MKLVIDDRGDKPKITVTRNGTVVYKKSGASIKRLLKMVYDGTKKQKTREAIAGLQPCFKLMVNSRTTLEIGD